MTVRLQERPGPGLSDLTDEDVLSLARRGDRLAVEHLLSRYRGLVEGKARSYFLSGADHEDVVQEGMIGLYKAIRDFQSERLPVPGLRGVMRHAPDHFRGEVRHASEAPSPEPVRAA